MIQNCGFIHNIRKVSPMKGTLNRYKLQTAVLQWLEEDMPYGDITSQNLICTKSPVKAHLIAKDNGLICGLEVFELVFRTVDATTTLIHHIEEGSPIQPGTLIAEINGPLQSILMAERLALNLLQRLSGIATMASDYSAAIRESPVRIVDTRKTTPGLRQLEKYAVRTGGCYNHRYSLSDAVMIKDNHIKAAGSITEAITSIRQQLPHTAKIEVEVESLEGLDEALDNRVDIIMLDNMDNTTMAAAVKKTAGRALLEASGNMTLDRIPSVADTGVDIISVGALTHSVKSLDISLKFQ